MSYTDIFMRHEIKFILSSEQKEKIISVISKYMEEDAYGKTTIRNLYYDTDDYRLVRASIEKPIYKEKLRIRTYSSIKDTQDVFVELKKKYKGVVYKRRLMLPYNNATAWLSGNEEPQKENQISHEIDYFKKYYSGLKAKVFLTYDRVAYKTKKKSDFRVTFDENIFANQSFNSLYSDIGGERVLADGLSIMEIKCSLGIPLWLTSTLSQERIYKASFSKYGNAYIKYFSNA